MPGRSGGSTGERTTRSGWPDASNKTKALGSTASGQVWKPQVKKHVADQDDLTAGVVRRVAEADGFPRLRGNGRQRGGGVRGFGRLGLLGLCA